MSYTLTYEIKNTFGINVNQLTPEAQAIFDEMVNNQKIISFDTALSDDGKDSIYTVVYKDKDAFDEHISRVQGITVDNIGISTTNFNHYES